jgi:hypothetical protein
VLGLVGEEVVEAFEQRDCCPGLSMPGRRSQGERRGRVVFSSEAWRDLL